MPYIIGGTDVEPHAYATMSEVRSAILTELGDRGYVDGPEHALCGDVADLSEASGGTIGPLPDGYVVDVQHVTWRWLAEPVGMYDTHRPDVYVSNRASVLDAYNAQ